MKKLMILIVLIVFAFNANAEAGDFSGNAYLFAGQKTLDKKDWEPLDEHPEVGAFLDFKKNNWPLSLAFNVLMSRDDKNLPIQSFGTVKLTGTTKEFDIGVRKVWGKQSMLHPYIGGGIALIKAELEYDFDNLSISESFDDSGTGFWVDAGVHLYINKSISLGALIKYSQAEATILDTTGEIGGIHAGITAGLHW